MNRLADIPVRLSIFFLGGLLFLPFLGNVPLFDWDEINFAESAREMLVSGDFLTVQINYLPFWEKPPLFIWMQALSFKFFGVNEYAARLPNAICGIITLQLLYSLGKRHFSELFGMLWVLIYAGSFLPHFYFKSGIIDPVFNLFIFLGIYHLLSLSFDDDFINPKKAKRQRRRSAIQSGFFIGLAVLTKGPVAILIQVAAGLVYFAITKGKKIFNRYEFLLWFIALAFTISFWYGPLFLKEGPWIFKAFIEYQWRLFSTPDAGHSGPFYYHFIVLLIGCFPASIFIFNAFRSFERDTINQKIIKRWMIALLVVVLVVFSIVETKIIHYSSLAYFPITFLAAYVIHKILKGALSWRWYHILLYTCIALIWSAAMILLPLIGMDTSLLTDNITIGDKNVLEMIKMPVVWNYWEVAFGVGYLLAIIATVVFFFKKMPILGLSWTFVSTALALQFILTLFTPKIERYTQHPAIEMFEAMHDKDVYVNVVGFKSYAHFFYAQKNDRLENVQGFQDWMILNGHDFDSMHSKDILQKEREWHLSGNIDKPAYFVGKAHNYQPYKDQYDLTEVTNQYGWVLLRRDQVVNDKE